MTYPSIDNLLFNDSVLYLISDPKILENKIDDNLSVLTSVVVPRSDLSTYRDTFLSNYRTLRYRYSTLYHFKLLYRYNVLDIKGNKMIINWDIRMDDYLLKRVHISDLDRKILMPSRWVEAANFCRRSLKKC